MMFGLFAITVTTIFFVSSLILLNYGRQLGLRYLRQHSVEGMTGLPTVIRRAILTP